MHPSQSTGSRSSRTPLPLRPYPFVASTRVRPCAEFLTYTQAALCSAPLLRKLASAVLSSSSKRALAMADSEEPKAVVGELVEAVAREDVLLVIYWLEQLPMGQIDTLRESFCLAQELVMHRLTTLARACYRSYDSAYRATDRRLAPCTISHPASHRPTSPPLWRLCRLLRHQYIRSDVGRG